MNPARGANATPRVPPPYSAEQQRRRRRIGRAYLARGAGALIIGAVLLLGEITHATREWREQRMIFWAPLLICVLLVIACAAVALHSFHRGWQLLRQASNVKQFRER